VVDQAVANSPTVEHVEVLRRQTPEVSLSVPKEIDWHNWL
jgi:hypothetical protein